MHESQRISGTTPSSTPSSDRTTGRGTLSGGNCPDAGGKFCRGLPMEKSARPRRDRCAVSPGASWSHPEAFLETVPAINRLLTARAAPTWLAHQVVDAATNCRTDCSQVRRGVRPVGRMAALASAWLELPEAGATRTRARSGGHRPVAPKRLVSHKKTRVVAGDRSFWSMNRALCCSRSSVAPGPHGAKPRYSIAGIGMTGSRSFRPLRSRPNASDWDSTSTSWITTLSPTTSSSSWLLSCVGWGNRSRWCWIVGKSTAPASEGSRPASAVAFTSNGCRPTLPNSIRRNMSGGTPSTPTWRTLYPTTYSISDKPSPDRSETRVKTKLCCVRFSITLNSKSDPLSSLVKIQ